MQEVIWLECGAHSLFCVSDEASPEWRSIHPHPALHLVTLSLLLMKLETRFDLHAQVRPSDQQFVLPQWRIYKSLKKSACKDLLGKPTFTISTSKHI